VRRLAFHRQARRWLSQPGNQPGNQPEADRLTLAGFLAAGRFSPYFVSHFMAPLIAAVWSCDPHTALRQPAGYLFRFLDHHGMLSVSGSPAWRTVTGGSRTYVDAVAKLLPEIRTGTAVQVVRRLGPGRGVEITDADGGTAHYDSVVLAVHADQALRMLAEPTADERRALGAFGYSRNPTVLHTDTSVLPGSRGAHASWNYRLPHCATPAPAVRITYDMNRLQRLDTTRTHLVTLNGGDRFDPDQILARTVHEHPVDTVESVAAQQRLPELSDAQIAYAGAYHGWGFHEDGCRSGVTAAAALGAGDCGPGRRPAAPPLHRAACPYRAGTPCRCATAPTCGWSISTGCRARPARCVRWPGSTPAITSAAPRPPCGPAWTASSPRTGCPSPAGRC
jgi:predicted NAD/FAD-binding protein